MDESDERIETTAMLVCAAAIGLAEQRDCCILCVMQEVVKRVAAGIDDGSLTHSEKIPAKEEMN